MPKLASFVQYSICIPLSLGSTTSASSHLSERCLVFLNDPRLCDPIAPTSFLPPSVVTNKAVHMADTSMFAEILNVLNVTQSDFFAPWLGTWPDSIDWTGAVIGTHISGAIRSISEDLQFLNPEVGAIDDWRLAANLVDSYFTHTVAYYFGQDAFAIRDEAYDDILWVVLGWLETIKFVNGHNILYYADGAIAYHGSRWIPTFSHRARIFWNLASRGWDTKLCNGGMIWNPRLLPYKNAITNELYIAASISMYLHFPGDDNQSPISKEHDRFNPNDPDAGEYIGPRDAKYLKAAVEGYRWLRSSNMTNSQGLFIDGFHISGYLDRNNNNTKCDSRDEVVFTYNQGVLLTGQRGLWDATGASSYLTDGHNLIQRVISATGYNLSSDSPVGEIDSIQPGSLPEWHGLGRIGVLEEYCDASGTCSQDGQTFKGIFFHHLTTFCAPLETSIDQLSVDVRGFGAIKESHAEACASYAGWLKHNVHAALGTKDKRGYFGQWWTAGLLKSNWTIEGSYPWPTIKSDGIPRGENFTDYRNYGIPDNSIWEIRKEIPAVKYDVEVEETGTYSPAEQIPMVRGKAEGPSGSRRRSIQMSSHVDEEMTSSKDPNDRGRGRTVETQSGGLALLRAYWVIARL
ncbi:glycosyl hydrolase family 76-domain-containing protein [Xylariaceae sp. FL0255]|nr:glycosyl hydrolase family 76-domain-containing protein [Xylariaceae sp. FL0255]